MPSDSNSSPPPPKKDSSSSSPHPPQKNSSSSPPPPPKGSSSPPPPSKGNSSPPPSDSSNKNNNNGNNGGNNGSNGNSNNGGNNDNNSINNNNGNNNKKSQPTPSSSNRNSYSPPPPPSSPGRSHGKALAPPHKSKSSGLSSSDGMDTTTKIIIGGVAGGAALLLLFMIACICCCCRKKKRKDHDEMHYYMDNSHENKNNAYFDSGPPNWRNPQSSEYHLQMPQPASGAVSSEYGWGAARPPPPPPMGHSSDMSSAAFSGPHQPAMPPPHPALALGFNKSTFTYDELADATGGFSKVNMLGQGGFGYVHKGVLPNGKEIAVKSLKSNSGQGEREFQAEVEIISRVHHRHLVSLVGYCIAGSQRMLVYEFVPNNTLEHHLHGKGVPVMEWSRRIQIALGSAKGFSYLHEDCHPRIIHRDIKTANILLDEHFEAKVADFGLAKLSNENITHVSTRIMGTFGYLAPEYASSGKLTEKSDVYSYGVMLLELITGKRPVDLDDDENDTLIDWARPILMRAVEGGSYDELVDPRLEYNYNPDEMLRMVACAASCIRHSSRRRPKMSQIVRALEGDVSLEDLNEGVKTGHGPLTGSTVSSEYDSSYSVDMKKFRKAGLSSQEYTSSEIGATSEYSHSSSGESQDMRANRNRMHTP